LCEKGCKLVPWEEEFDERVYCTKCNMNNVAAYACESKKLASELKNEEDKPKAYAAACKYGLCDYCYKKD
jgi:hypothetical protein